MRPPPTVSNLTSPTSSKFGLGSIYHFRVADRLSRALSSYNDIAEKTGVKLLDGEEGVRLLRQHRVDKQRWLTIYRDKSSLVQDWTLLEVMGPALQEVLKRKQRWGAARWFEKGVRRPRGTMGGSGESLGARVALVVVWLVLMLAVLRPTWRKAQLGMSGGKELMMKENPC